MRILLVKTSSLGDVIHNLPVVTDLRQNFPDAMIDWVVEEDFAEIPRLHPEVRRVIPVAVRRWRRSLPNPSTWTEVRSFRRTLQAEHYDLVIDTQGLLKSAFIARMAHGKRCGYTASSAREPVAARFYDAVFEVSKDLHAVERNRRLAAAAADYRLSSAPDYGVAASCPRSGTQSMHDTPSPSFGESSAVLLTATSRDDKLWPEECWIEAGRALHQKGLVCLLPSGNSTERQRAARIALAIPDAVALPSLSLTELAQQLVGARIVIGVDTGLAHLAAALGRPTLALFSASDPALTGVLAETPAVNLGTRGQPPSVDNVLTTAARFL
ncbi:MAG: lipopolysaccharide heptosyltransferase I [Sulfuritalea sp.]|nr:lipopolysaccharide heptosyltransferase I [Sulfuritalea sp.]